MTKPPSPAHPATAQVRSGNSRLHPDLREKPSPGWYWLYGLHAVEAALANPNRNKGDLLLTRNAALRLGPVLEAVGRQPKISNRAKFAAILGTAVHQGAALHVQQLTPPSLEGIARQADGQPILVLDRVTDPRNVGAILRSAGAFDAAALVTPWRHAAPESAVMAKAASGGLEHVPYVRVRNLSRSLGMLQDQGFVMIGLDSQVDQDLVAIIGAQSGRSLAVVLGSEDRGLRQGTRESCDHLATIRHTGPIPSLNVSNAAAIALFLMTARRDGESASVNDKQ